jgi:glycosyltransferase involved in cell wall biosynthesis
VSGAAPLRVAMFTGPERCGIAHYTDALVRAMPPAIAVTVVRGTFDSQSRDQYTALGARLNDAGVVHVQHEYAYWGGMGPDTGYFAFMGTIRRPVVMTVHELDLRVVGTRGLPGPLERAYKRWFNRRMFRHPAIRRWLTHSTDVAAALVSLGVPEASVETLPMPVPEPVPMPSPEEAKAALGLQGRRVLTIFGFLARRKGYDVALEALARLPDDVVLLAAGGVHEADQTAPDAELRAAAERRGVGNRIRITGYLPEAQVPVVLGATDLFLAPFREVTGSASLALGQAYGCAILASDLPALRESGAAFFPSGDAAALAEAAMWLLEQPHERERLSAATRAIAARQSFGALAERTAAIYREGLGVGSGGLGKTDRTDWTDRTDRTELPAHDAPLPTPNPQPPERSDHARGD